MILYQGKILENSRQDELIESMINVLYKPIESGMPLSTDTVINACDQLAAKIKNGEYDHIVKPFLSLFNISEKQFQDMVRLFTREGLEYKCSIELSDEERTIDGKILRKRYPLGVLLHIAAGNVDILPAYSVVEGLLSGNINILNKEGFTLRDIKSNKKKKIIECTMSSVVFSFIFIFFIWLFTYLQMIEEEQMPWALYWFMILLFGFPIIGIIYNLVGRIKEINGGEEDEASKY